MRVTTQIVLIRKCHCFLEVSFPTRGLNGQFDFKHLKMLCVSYIISVFFYENFMGVKVSQVPHKEFPVFLSEDQQCHAI